MNFNEITIIIYGFDSHLDFRFREHKTHPFVAWVGGYRWYAKFWWNHPVSPAALLAIPTESFPEHFNNSATDDEAVLPGRFNNHHRNQQQHHHRTLVTTIVRPFVAHSLRHLIRALRGLQGFSNYENLMENQLSRSTLQLLLLVLLLVHKSQRHYHHLSRMGNPAPFNTGNIPQNSCPVE